MQIIGTTTPIAPRPIPLRIARHGAVASATAEATREQVVMLLVRRTATLIDVKLVLDRVKGGAVENGWDSDGNPVLLGACFARGLGDGLILIDIGHASCIRFIDQDFVHRGRLPGADR